jgi:hypothetical protein
LWQFYIQLTEIEAAFKNLRSFPDFAGKERFAFGEQRTSSPLASIV